MGDKYKEFNQLNMPAIEQEWLKIWEDGHFFEKSIELRKGQKPFVFYEGPPSANGMPGIHHVISRTLKDLVCRYKTMQGFQVNRKAGWDTHGLPVELGVEKELGITKEDIGTKISVEDYNLECRKVVMRYKNQWDNLTKKMGYWVDLDHPYVTFEKDYIETLWWALKELYNKDLLYKSISIQPFSPAAGTGLSSHELNQPGAYKNVKDTTAVVLFKMLFDDQEDSGNPIALSTIKHALDNTADVYLMAWTTTPWTLPSNAALTVGPNIDYVLVKTFNPYTYQLMNVFLAKELIGKHFKAEAENTDFKFYSAESKLIPWKILAEIKGSDLEGIRYEQLFSFENNRAHLSGGDPFRIITGDFVTTEDGSGIVHTAPAFGADDFKVGSKNNIGIFTLIDRQGKFIEGSGIYSGRFVKNYQDDPNYEDVNVDLVVELKLAGKAFKIEKYEHSYPHCWRTDKPIIYYPLDAWFIRTTALKDRMVELNKTINWKPKATGEGRFGNWLENMVDWNLSRSRFWGTPLPIWVSEDGTEIKCIGSVAELKDEIQKAITAGIMPHDSNLEALTSDLHKPYVDKIHLVSKSGKLMLREPDLIDVWFDSGAMPYAQWHFPFENKELFAQNYPADFIAEGVDQTRGWFYTLHALGSLLKESVQRELKEAGIEATNEKYSGLAYKAVVSNGLVLDKSGNKMSKRIGNVVDPFQTIEKYSADATRWYLITNAAPWDSLRFDLKGIEEVQRKFFGTLYNTYQFFALYANVDGFSFKETYIPIPDRPELDQWILSALNSLIQDVEKSLNDYEPTQAGRAIELFVGEYLSNWYVRLSRRRFWKGDYEHDKICAFQTLYECLEKLCLLIAPIAPFFADWLFHNLNRVSGREQVASVHHALFPISNPKAINKELEERMELAQTISSLILSIRKKVNIKVRQPLQKILIPLLDSNLESQIEKVKSIILSEVNVKEIAYLSGDDGFIKKKIKPNFKVLGKKAGPHMKTVAILIQKFSQDEISRLEAGHDVELNIDGIVINILPEDVEIIAEDIPGWAVANKENVTVALDITISDTLKEEGIAREFINRIQKIRKDLNLDLMDRIHVQILNDNTLKESILNYKDYISLEVLADTLEISNQLTALGTEVEVNEEVITVLISKI